MTEHSDEAQEEMVDVINEDNEVVKTVPRSVMRKENLMHRLVIIMVFNSKEELFVQKRSENKDVYPGYWALSAGGTVATNETYEEAAKRELAEEIGVTTAPTFVRTVTYEDEHTRFIAHLYGVIHDGEISFNDGEVSEGKWVSKVNLAKLMDAENFTGDSLEIAGSHYDEVWERIQDER